MRRPLRKEGLPEHIRKGIVLVRQKSGEKQMNQNDETPPKPLDGHDSEGKPIPGHWLG